jgi:hypothetical protein
VSTIDPLPWLQEPDNPSARYLTLIHLLDRDPDDPDVMEARAAIPEEAPAHAILEAQWPEGYWMRPGIGYSPKHKATVWQVIFLAALGAPCTEAIQRACSYILDHSRLEDGLFSAYKTAQGAVACLNGNLMRAMLLLGFRDARLDESLEAAAAAAVRDDFRCRFNARSPKPARMRDGLPCAWGAIKMLGAFAQVPVEKRSACVRAAVESGTALLSSGDLVQGGYPAAYRPSPLWHRFGFPLGYTSDLLEALQVLGQLRAAGSEADPESTAALELVRSKSDSRGRWQLEYTPDNTWSPFGDVGKPNKWVTLHALLTLKVWEEER